MGSQAEHSRLVNEILVALSRFAEVRVWKHHNGVAMLPTGQPIAFGLPGSADIIGIVAPKGTFLALECKTGNAKQTKKQIAFEQMIASRGGAYSVCRSVDEALDFVATLL